MKLVFKDMDYKLVIKMGRPTYSDMVIDCNKHVLQ